MQIPPACLWTSPSGSGRALWFLFAVWILGASCTSPRVPIRAPVPPPVEPAGVEESAGQAEAPAAPEEGTDLPPGRARLHLTGELTGIDVLDVVVAGPYAFLAAGAAGLEAVEIRSPSFPQAAGRLASITIRSLDVSGTYVFAASEEGLEIIDAYIPTLPALVERTPLPAPAWDVVVQGNTAYIADGTAGLIMVDVATPTFARAIAGVDTPGRARAVALGDGFALVADEGSGLLAIELSYFPSIVGSADTGPSTVDVVVQNSLAYAADQVSGLSIVDISDPTSLWVVGGYQPPGEAQAVAVSGDHLFLVDGRFLFLLDVSDPAAPRVRDQIPVPGRPQRVVLDGDLIYVAAGRGGLQIGGVSEEPVRRR